MPQIIFKIDLKQDAKNWVRIAKMKRPRFGRSRKDLIGNVPKDLLKKLAALPKNKAEFLAYKHLDKNSKNFLPGLKANKELLEFYFKSKGNDLFRTLAKVTGKPIYAKKFTATFTLMTSCPYDPKYDWFMVAANRPVPRQITNICHEILHLQFIHYYQDYCFDKGLTAKQFQDLKESTTFLLNEPAFKKFLLAPDRGYPNHQELRRRLKRIWNNEKDFNKFLDRAIELTKKEFK